MEKKESENLYGDRFKKTNKVLKVLGFIFLPIGIICELIGFIDFFNAFETFGSPKLFFLKFIGMPILFVGIVCLTLGYRKQITEFHADSVAGVNKDISNFMIDGTRDSITKTAQSIHEAIRNNNDNAISINVCEKCGEKNPINARFCSKCGSQIIIKCPSCGQEMDDGANFCNKCGYRLK